MSENRPDDPTAQAALQSRNARQARVLGLVVLGMFGFGFAMVPLYEKICQVTGWNNANAVKQAEMPTSSWVDRARTVRIGFDVTRNQGLAWDVRPSVKSASVHPGELNQVSYHVTNNSDRTMTVQAVPGVTPWQATAYLRKIECFCFNQQTLAPGESAELPLRYVIDPDLPGQYGDVTLSYTFMDTDNRQQSTRAGSAGRTPG